MEDNYKIKMVVATTHVDNHGDQFTKEALDGMADDPELSNSPRWIYWNHETTVPPIGSFNGGYVELRDDGEYQLVSEGILFNDDSYEYIYNSDLDIPDISFQDIDDTLTQLELTEKGIITIGYDRINYNEGDIKKIVESLNEIIPTEQQMIGRKSEIPQEVIWIFVGFTGGILTRFGERTADYLLDGAKSLYKDVISRFNKIFDLKPEINPDIIMKVPLDGDNTIVEAIVEDANKDLLDIALKSLPIVYAIATKIISKAPKDHFFEMKFILNPQSKQWEINYFTLRKDHKILLGQRYYQKDHPSYARWQKIMDQLRNSNQE
jgi:hypothetical protein